MQTTAPTAAQIKRAAKLVEKHRDRVLTDAEKAYRDVQEGHATYNSTSLVRAAAQGHRSLANCDAQEIARNCSHQSIADALTIARVGKGRTAARTVAVLTDALSVRASLK